MDLNLYFIVYKSITYHVDILYGVKFVLILTHQNSRLDPDFRNVIVSITLQLKNY